MIFTWWLAITSVFYVIPSSTSAVDVIGSQRARDASNLEASSRQAYPDVDGLFESSSSSSSSSFPGYYVTRNQFLPNGVFVFGIFEGNECALSCILPCTAADFDDKDRVCWHHYRLYGCTVSTLYRPGNTHFRNFACDPQRRQSSDVALLTTPGGVAANTHRQTAGDGLLRGNPLAALIVPPFGRLSPQDPLFFGDSQLGCGHPALPPYEARIIGGDEARPRSWPWQIALRNKSSRSSRCAGSIIAQQWILTTAHCVDQDPDPNNWLVLTGAHDLLAVERERAALSVDRIIIHKHFSLDTFDNDIALLRLVNPIKWSPTVSPVCLPPKDLELDGGTKCVITGWGMANNGKRPLKQAGIPLVSADTCRRSDWLGSEFTITERMICAGFASGGVDTCQGDSGGPLMCYLEGHWVQIGVTSFGRGCGLPQKPGIYTKVSKFTQWIQSIIAKRKHL